MVYEMFDKLPIKTMLKMLNPNTYISIHNKDYRHLFLGFVEDAENHLINGYENSFVTHINFAFYLAANREPTLILEVEKC